MRKPGSSQVSGRFQRAMSGWKLLLVPALLSAGCSSMSRAEKGALIGGGAGAVVGNMIGKATGSRTAGTVLGAGLGAIGGAVIGDSQDKAIRKAEAQGYANAMAQQQMTVADVVSMTQQGVPPSTIITQIRTTGSVFRLTAQDLITLNNNGVDRSVIREMQLARGSGARPVVVQEVVPVGPPPQPVYVIQPGAPPPPSASIDIQYRR